MMKCAMVFAARTDELGETSCADRSDVFFFFKQKTAYEMRISDRSSDVCSSDLAERKPRGRNGSSSIANQSGNNCVPALSSRKLARRYKAPQIGRASCRERVCQYV